MSSKRKMVVLGIVDRERPLSIFLRAAADHVSHGVPHLQNIAEDDGWKKSPTGKDLRRQTLAYYIWRLRFANASSLRALLKS